RADRHTEALDREDGAARHGRRSAHRADDEDAGPPPASPTVGSTVPRLFPPSTASVAPVMNDAWGEQRNRMAFAASSGPDARPSGIRASMASTYSGGSGLTTLPGANPGDTAFTRIRCGASSSASPAVSRSSAAFDTLYGTEPVRTRCAAPDVMLTTAPWTPAAIMRRAISRVRMNGALRLTSMIRSHSSTGTSRRWPRG